MLDPGAAFAAESPPTTSTGTGMANWQTHLERWRAAGLVDAATAERIGNWERTHGRAAGRDRLAHFAFGLGGLLLAAGVLLFVAAHWDELSPGARFALVLLLVGILHGAGAIAAERSPGLATTLHAVGTAALGAGIFLSGQIFHMAEHWPGALLLWTIGAVAALLILRDWPHVLWVAVLAPAWLVAEWIELFEPLDTDRWIRPVCAGLTLLALAYLSARTSEHPAGWRTVLTRLGAVALIPVALFYGVVIADGTTDGDIPATWNVLGWVVALLAPAAVAYFLRRRDALWLLPAPVWVLLLAALPEDSVFGELSMYLLYALAAVGVVLLGLREQQRLIVNLGVLGFALTVLFFYFASVFDRFGRSLGLIGLGVVFIGGGWLLERTRRQLVGRIGGSPA